MKKIDEIALSAGNIENMIVALNLLHENSFSRPQDIRIEDLCALDGLVTTLSILSEKHSQLIEEFQSKGDN